MKNNIFALLFLWFTFICNASDNADIDIRWAVWPSKPVTFVIEK